MEPNRNKLNLDFTRVNISYYKNEISLLKNYLNLTFDSINKSINNCEYLVELISKQTKNNGDNSYYSESMSTDEKTEDIIDLFKDIYCHKKIGKYHWRIRAMKIIKYKMKLIMRFKNYPIIKKFSGRSKVASLKPRAHGRFVKKN
jgi:hypothetical protein